jgi:hypothetical protein
MQTVERFIPHLTGTEESKKVALLALSSLGSPEFATRFAQLNPSAGTEFAADVIMATASPAQQSQLPVPVSSTAAATGNEGWAYLGHFERSTGNWRTKYFDFDRRAVPDSLQNLALQVSQETGALNVRVGMPTPDGRFAEIIDVLTPGSKATIHEVREWHSTGYMWARITYGT